MYSALIAIIYLAFISLGLPDSLLGSGWPVMQVDLGAPLSYAGIITMIICGGTILSSLMSDLLTRKLSPGLVTALSTGMTALALFGFSVSRSFAALCLWAVPYGLGAGAVDAALNNYVALHYSSRHMSWLHACWGVGASISPHIMSHCLSAQLGWRMGYRSVSVIQFVLTLALFLTLPLWRKTASGQPEETTASHSLTQTLRIPGVPLILLAFFGFCALENTAALWASSYLTIAKGFDVETAARFGVLFYLGETVGRFLNGFVADKFGDRAMIRAGILTMIAGVLLMLLPAGSSTLTLTGLLICGLGAAPVYPCIIHSTPANFGKENSQALVGIQMASAYVGSTFMPPLFGLLAQHISISLYPFYLGFFALLMLLSTRLLNQTLAAKE